MPSERHLRADQLKGRVNNPPESGGKGKAPWAMWKEGENVPRVYSWKKAEALPKEEKSKTPSPQHAGRVRGGATKVRTFFQRRGGRKN